MPFSTELDAAIAFLKSKGVIKFDKEILAALGYKSKGTLSEYKEGSKPISPEFRTQFESFYKVRLADFADKVNPAPEQAPDSRYAEIEKALAGRDQEPLVQIIFNLTYVGRKDADTVNKLAEARLIDSGTISRLLDRVLSSDYSNTPDPKQNREPGQDASHGDLRKERPKAGRQA